MDFSVEKKKKKNKKDKKESKFDAVADETEIALAEEQAAEAA